MPVCHEMVGHWWNRFGPMFAADIRRQRVYVKLNGKVEAITTDGLTGRR